MANYIGSILSSYSASSLFGNTSSPNFMNSSSAYKTGAGMFGSNFATIASDYKALQTKKYNTLSSSYSYLKTVASSEYATESQSATDKADASKVTPKQEEKTITLSANQMSSVYGKYASESHLLNILV